MAVVITKNVDISRLAKVYPYVRREPRFVKQTDRDIEVELGSASFGGSDSVTYNFNLSYSTVPTVVLSPRGDNVVVWISALTNTYVTFGSSAPTNATVDFQILTIQ
jgi:hypothetical protein